MRQKFIMGVDHGTTCTKAILFDREGKIAAKAYRELSQIYPAPGWVEQDPLEIWEITKECFAKVINDAGISPADVAAIGLANQGETVVAWDSVTVKPYCNAIVWQCRRTDDICRKLVEAGLEETVRLKTGLTIDPYFSATKIKWILEHVTGVAEGVRRGHALIGTTDAWLAWLLSGGRLHVTDPSTASRTMIYNIHTQKWDEELLQLLGIPADILPRVVGSSGVCGQTDPKLTMGVSIPLAGLAVDQQAALLGHGCFNPGMAKATYGTGCFLLMNTGQAPVRSRNGLLTSIAWSIEGEVEYVLDGAVFTAGAAVQWLRDGLNLIQAAAESERLALEVADTAGAYFVPAFTGLSAPYWDMDARGTIVGLTRGVTRQHLVRATLESIAYQVRDVLEAIEKDAGMKLEALRADGGASHNVFLMQFQADILGIPVEVPHCTEATALGAAYLAGRAIGFWADGGVIRENARLCKRYEPHMDDSVRKSLYAGWKRAVDRSRKWIARDMALRRTENEVP